MHLLTSALLTFLLCCGTHAESSISWRLDETQHWTNTGDPFLVLDDVAFVLLPDGNLVVADYSSNALWNSASTGHSCTSGCFAQWQGDGNFVLYESGNVPYWSTSTNSYTGHAVAADYIMFQDRAPYIVLWSDSLGALWTTNGFQGSYYNPENDDTYEPTDPGSNPPSFPVQDPCAKRRRSLKDKRLLTTCTY